jgi:hypothetical protein
MGGGVTRAALRNLACAGFPIAGLLFTAAYGAANRGHAGVHELFWAATGVALASAAGVLALSRNRAAAAAVLAAVLAVVLSLPKYLRAPAYFNFYDELAHYRATRALLEGDHLFAGNVLNKIVADYPGLHALTAVVASTTGVSVFAAGNAVILAARVTNCLAVFLLARSTLRAPGAALVAVAVFAANPAFAFFDAQYAYESLALPLVSVVLVLALRLAPPRATDAVPTFAAALALALAVIVTHHGSSYVLAGLLVLIILIRYALRRPPSRYQWALAGTVVAATLGWLLGLARTTLAYIGPYVHSNLTSIPQFLAGGRGPRRLFGGFLPIPAYERVASFVAVPVLFGLFDWGGWRLLRRARPRHRRVSAAVLALLGAGYFLSLPLVALRGDQVAKRLWEFGFLGAAPLCAAGLWSLARRWRWAGRVAAAALVAVAFVGGAVARSGEHIRFPGPYRPSADPRSMTPDMVAAARWLYTTRGPNHRVVGDRTLAAVMGSYGEQDPVTYQEDGRPVWKIFMPDALTPAVTAEVRGSGTAWIAVDLRTAGQFPLTGFYFDESEPGAYVDTRLTMAGLTKFDAGPYRRAYDNGDVVLYEVAP